MAGATNQASIDAHLDTVTDDELEVLKSYDEADAASAKGLAKVQVNAAGGANLFDKVLARAKALKTIRVYGNRVDRN